MGTAENHHAGDRSSASLDVLLWRVKTLEAIETAIREEIHQLQRTLPSDYYSKYEAQTVFLTRKELQDRTMDRKQWPIIVSTIAIASVAVTNLILTLTTFH